MSNPARRAPAQVLSVPDAMIASLTAAMRHQFGSGAVPTAATITQLMSVVPCPLAFEFLFGTSGVPLSRIIELCAPPGNGKTALMTEMGRWFLTWSDGLFAVIENESKLDIDWIRAFISDQMSRFIPLDSNSLDSATKLIVGLTQQYVVNYQAQAAKRRSATLPIPAILIGLDSVTGQQAEETQVKVIGAIDKFGRRSGGGEAVGRTRGAEPLILAKFFRSIGELIHRWPITLVCVNQLRLSAPAPGTFVPKKDKAGGQQIDFAKAYEIEVYRHNSLKSNVCEGNVVRLKLGKSSGGSDRRELITRVQWWYDTDPATGLTFKQAKWDWDWSLVRTLTEILYTDRFPYFKPRLAAEGIHVKPVKTGDDTNTAWSSTLGQKESQAVSWGELGLALTESDEIRQRIRRALGIVERPAVTGDFIQQLSELEAQVP